MSITSWKNLFFRMSQHFRICNVRCTCGKFTCCINGMNTTFLQGNLLHICSLYNSIWVKYYLAHPRHFHFYVSTRPKYSCATLTPYFYVSTWSKYSCASLTTQFLFIYSTKIFLRIPNTSISMYLLDQNVLAHLWHLNSYISAQPKYSCTSLTPPFLQIYSTKILLLHLWHLHFYISTWPKYSCASLTLPFLRF